MLEVLEVDGEPGGVVRSPAIDFCSGSGSQLAMAWNRIHTPDDMMSMNRKMAVIALCATVLAACGGEDDSGLSPAAAEGRQIARDQGCAACHGADGQGGVGPAWVGLAGSAVELEDGSVVPADTEYLRRSITDPAADLVAGYTTKMPEYTLTDAQVDAIVIYIEELK
jgi:mono/diheme cytochrome c family protein